MNLLSFMCFYMELTFVQYSDGKKFVALLYQVRSKLLPVVPIARELEIYNHSVTFVLNKKMQQMLVDQNINVSYISHSTKDVDGHRSSVEMAIKSQWEKLIGTAAILRECCHNLMTNIDLFMELQQSKFDYAIVEMDPVGCYDILAYKLSLPFIFVGDDDDSVFNRVPINPSFMPIPFSAFVPFGIAMTDRMNFLQRIVNLIMYAIRFLTPSLYSVENLVKSYVPEKPYISFSQLKKKSLLNILDIDPLLMFPKPVPPNVIYCGGLSSRPARYLPLDIEKFVQKSKEGIVIVSFGSIISTMSQELKDKFIDTFKNLTKYNYIFRLADKQQIYIENLLTLPWIPQNDLVGHSKARLLITHCGQSSIHEALYHGIPMICFPIDLDQPENAAIIESKGYGVSMDILHFSIEELKRTILHITAGNYTNVIRNAKEIFHSRPLTPSQRAAYWIDMVTKYGNKHFRHASLDMNWYSYYMLDVIAFLTLFCALIVLSTRYTYRKFLYLVWKTDKNKHKKE